MAARRSSKYRPNSGESEWDKNAKDSGSIPKGVVWLALVAGILFCTMGWNSALKDIAELSTLKAIESFKPVSAKWLKVSVRHDTAGAAEDHHPDVLYEYFVGGKSIWGWRFSYEEMPHPKTFWEMRLRPYRQGDSVTAYVSETDPKISLIEKKSDGLFRPYLKLFMSLGFVAVGILLLLVPLAVAVSRLKKGSQP
jgi:hypothetical protein